MRTRTHTHTHTRARTCTRTRTRTCAGGPTGDSDRDSLHAPHFTRGHVRNSAERW